MTNALVAAAPQVQIPLPVPRYTKRCIYCGVPIHGLARVCSAHRDLVIHDPLDVRYRPPKYRGMRARTEKRA